MDKEDLRNIPSVSELLELPEISELSTRYPRPLVVSAIRDVLEGLREVMRGPQREELDLSPHALLPRVNKRLLEKASLPMQRVINATGVVIHTCLGRSPLAQEALKNALETAKGYCSLEIDLLTGKRAPRGEHLEALTCALTGAEAAMVVNNNAAAVLLALDSLAKGKEAIISRSQLVEIGGSFRMPEVMAKSGAIMVEVGTTNRTYLSDYRKAITPNTALFLQVHPSNFRIVGFTTSVETEELVRLGREYGIPVMYDLGSGALIDYKALGLSHESTVEESVKAGVDITTFSTDKLLGGPQGGLIVGRKRFVDIMKSNPFARALRVDKLTIAALEATLRLYSQGEKLAETLPIQRMLTKKLEDVEKECRRFLKELYERAGNRIRATVEDGVSTVGGGSLPGEEIPTKLVSLSLEGLSAQELSDELRLNNPSIFGRIEKERFLLDLRTLGDEAEVEEILSALLRILEAKQ
ncbi:MAG TPA: L-seryl-tRNA(Sec) selenium transferase [Candidatus Hypogeohydataceae bacterium YC38]|nr:L-seryl-tRNA(Sec) selenium transferase [Candidatus Brocadiales bacterium]